MSELRPDTFRPITYKNVLFWFVTFLVLGCQCPLLPDNTPPPRPTPISVMTLSTPGVVFAPAETFTLTVRTTLAPGESAGQTVIVTPRVPAGFTVTPTQRSTVLQTPQTVTTFQVTTPASGDGTFSLYASRTAGTIVSGVTLEAGMTASVLPQLVSVTVDPRPVTVAQGGTRDLTLTFLPRGNTSGPVDVRLHFPRTGLSLNTSVLSLTMVNNPPTPVTRTVRITAQQSAALGDQPLIYYMTNANPASSNQFHTHNVTVTAASANPSYTFTATPLEVTSATYAESVPVTFTITSQNGFAGDVVVSQESDGEVGVLPTYNDETFTVSPTAPTTFTRRFQRYFGTADIHITFTATNAANAISRQVVITSKHP